jgi:hypothetical protein
MLIAFRAPSADHSRKQASAVGPFPPAKRWWFNKGMFDLRQSDRHEADLENTPKNSTSG